MNALERRIARLETLVGSVDEHCPVCDGIIGGVDLLQVVNEHGEPMDD